ncbi:RagB/SusD family nutrient uptake outer membrane protein [Dysgonomonas sp. BGC7]|uniref:RagB/SusD family nutrient uptake outer membrane protein n=1 Tax=Dysgonomonas sp. BGC7 TaxID=1658008 RepID=UPI00068317C4|nr:RagB/SusD family nutrient uptake outer membrane protein [Dysgonomonas sp. BGC7]MBD8389319.1 SusD/RagB family nutrient-binding outer membrane lipoprotein [Dysgonomonas sp. BGC7]
MLTNRLYKYAKLITTSVIVGTFTMGCTDSYMDYNENKHQASEYQMSLDNLKTGAFFSQMQRNVVIFKDGVNASSDYQVAQGLSSDLYAGYVAPTGTWLGGVHNGSYAFQTGWIAQMFEKPFVYVMPAWQSVSKISKDQGLPHIAALATVVKVAGMHRVADTYGPIPYVNFGGGELQSGYDSLEDVYKKFFEELDKSIDELTAYVIGNPGVKIMEDFDYVYQGDATKWVKFANTLRLRLAMRVVYADATLAQREAEKSINNPIGVITASNEKASLKHSSDLIYYHPLWEIKDFNAGEARMNASMDAYMNGYADPRRARYFTPAVSDGGYHGVRLGIVTTSWGDYVGNKISSFNMDQSSTEIVWMSAAESYFLRAEGAIRGWSMGGTAQDFYEKGIAVSFEETGAGAATTYIASSATPAAYVDNAKGSNGMVAPSTIAIKWSETDTNEKKLERIITQKWIAMFPNGPEGWAEFRRTGYPKLFPVVSNRSNGTINTDIQVRRIPYPQSEYNKNEAGVQSGIAKLGGADNGGTKLWWDKK